MPNGQQYQPRVPAMVQGILAFLKKYNSHCTFFTVGDIARAYPEIIAEIVAHGHEIALHSNLHETINNQTPIEFEYDLAQNIESLIKAGASNIIGYRAPVFSLTPQTQWAYPILAKHGVKYSSSVLPAKNPLFGWHGFGQQPKQMGDVLEIPMTLGKYLHLTVPFGGGVYFRLMDRFSLMRNFAAKAQQGVAVTSYFHPYDFDTQQERFMHPGINNSQLYNFLMYYNRRAMYPRLERIMQQGFKITPYRTYAGL